MVTYSYSCTFFILNQIGKIANQQQAGLKNQLIFFILHFIVSK